ncbi:MAG: hypothetical protein JOY71_02925 [Acetobacteraceae bacterium]|nr:hypothetical protein [Acetobacteraceae bacterium]
MDFIALLGRTALNAIFMWSGIGTLMAPVATIKASHDISARPLTGRYTL